MISKPALAKITPEKPPIENKKIKLKTNK